MSVYGNKINNEYLEPDMCFCAWLIGGSIGKARKRLLDEGIKNPETGNPPSRMGIWFSSKKSTMYKAFIKNREDNNVTAELPTKAEYEDAIAVFNRLTAAYHAKFG